jgi:FtsP/CotA-like multicopper oxidase with cupredoxin domain
MSIVRPSLSVCVLSGLWLALAVPSPAAGQPLQPADWSTGVSLHEAVDRNPDPRIVEIDLEARLAEVEYAPGRRIEAWTYDGRLPGPLIRVRVGDRLIVHFTNRLPKPTTVHWHGLRVPIQMDGVPGASQPEVETGGSFTYDFVVPDAGLFWYHPHVMSATQVGFGLSGPMLVEDPEDGVGIDDELVLVLSDLSILPSGEMEPADSGGNTARMFGREGTFVLTNGRTAPSIVARAGARQRWRVVNAAKSRYFDLRIEGLRFTRIGGDGGLLEYPTEHESVVLAPGERADLIVTPVGTPGDTLVLRSMLFDRGYGSTEFREVPTLLTMRLADMPAHTPAPLPSLRRAIAPLDQTGATPVSLELALEGLTYRIDSDRFGKGKPLRAALGETQIWTVTNPTSWSHPLHIHGFFFQVLPEKGAPPRPLEWKDTVDVPYGKSVRFIVRFDDDRPGSWMVHCHILDHADGGLMTTVDVGVSAAPADHSTHRTPESR